MLRWISCYFSKIKLSIPWACIALSGGLAACSPEQHGAQEAYGASQAYRDWAAQCPDHPAELREEDDASAPIRQAAHRGDPDALDCMIAMYAYLEQPFDADGEPSSVFRMMRLQTLYVRWRLTGERQDEALALADQMDAELVDRATFAYFYNESGIDMPQVNSCGMVDRHDPAFTLVSRAYDFDAYWREDCPETAP